LQSKKEQFTIGKSVGIYRTTGHHISFQGRLGHQGRTTQTPSTSISRSSESDEDEIPSEIQIIQTVSPSHIGVITAKHSFYIKLAILIRSEKKYYLFSNFSFLLKLK
jgi:hypothetical protein